MNFIAHIVSGLFKIQRKHCDLFIYNVILLCNFSNFKQNCIEILVDKSLK